jgi:hypothetical protein
MWETDRCKKGQLWSLDLITGLAVLSFIILLFLTQWNGIAQRWNYAGKQTAMEASAFFAAESLLATPGSPSSWEMLPQIDGNITAIGLVNGRNEFDRLKVEKLMLANATSYDYVKARLGLQRYQFGFRITDLSRNQSYYSFGRFPQLNSSLSFDRLGILDGNPVILHMEVWGG